MERTKFGKASITASKVIDLKPFFKQINEVCDLAIGSRSSIYELSLALGILVECTNFGKASFTASKVIDWKPFFGRKE